VETTASIEGISGITSGGGFSQFVSQPPWQNSSIPSYLENAGNLPPVGSYNVEGIVGWGEKKINGTEEDDIFCSGRGYPDISLLGHNYEVFGSILENEKIEIVVHLVNSNCASYNSWNAGYLHIMSQTAGNYCRWNQCKHSITGWHDHSH